MVVFLLERKKEADPNRLQKVARERQKAILLENARGLTLTSGGAGTVDGNGAAWWGAIQYLLHREDRPKLLTIQNATDVLVEDWHFRQSAYHTFHADDVARLEIRRCSVDNRVNAADSHDVLNLGALNTDGFDVSGRDIYAPATCVQERLRFVYGLSCRQHMSGENLAKFLLRDA